jgi:hypothetical protein
MPFHDLLRLAEQLIRCEPGECTGLKLSLELAFTSDKINGRRPARTHDYHKNVTDR